MVIVLLLLLLAFHEKGILKANPSVILTVLHVGNEENPKSPQPGLSPQPLHHAFTFALPHPMLPFALLLFIKIQPILQSPPHL